MQETSKICTIYVVRHGQSVANAMGVEAGQSNSPLTDFGRKQAEELSLALKNIHFDGIYSSDLSRAEETAKMAAQGKGLEVRTEISLRERNFGSWQTKPITDYEAARNEALEKNSSLTQEEKLKIKLDKYFESDAELIERFTGVLRQIAADNLGKTVLVVGHSSMMKALLVSLGWAKLGELKSGCIENSGYAVLESDGEKFTVKQTQGIKKL